MTIKALKSNWVARLRISYGISSEDAGQLFDMAIHISNRTVRYYKTVLQDIEELFLSGCGIEDLKLYL